MLLVETTRVDSNIIPGSLKDLIIYHVTTSLCVSELATTSMYDHKYSERLILIILEN